MAEDDKTRYVDVGGVLALKDGATVDPMATRTMQTSTAARLREVTSAADAAMTEALRPRFVVTRDHTIILAAESTSGVVVDPESHTLTMGA